MRRNDKTREGHLVSNCSVKDGIEARSSRSTANYRYIPLAKIEFFCAVLGCVGDLCRATQGEGETEPKQIGEGTQDSTPRQGSPETQQPVLTWNKGVPSFTEWLRRGL